MTYSGIFDKKIIPDSLYHTEILCYLNDQTVRGLSDKNIATRIFSAKQPKILGRKMNGEFFDVDFNPISIDELIELVNNNKWAFIKPSKASSCGDGTYKWNNNHSIDEVRAILSDENKNLIIQDVVDQHEKLAKFHLNSLNTVRVVTLRINNNVVILNAILRMGRNNSYIDNYSAGEVITNLDEKGYLFSENVQASFERLTEHPDTHIPFKGQKVFDYEKIISEAKAQSNFIPFFRMIS